MIKLPQLLKSALLLLPWLMPVAWAEPFQDHASIEQAARTFLTNAATERSQGKVEVSMNPLDRRLKLALCTQPLDVSLAPGAKLLGATSTRVSCASDTPWSLYVTGKISIYGYTLVTRRALNRGERLTAADVQSLEKDLSNLHYGYFTSAEEVLGQQTTRTLPAGQVLTPHLLKAPLLIRRGDRVTLMAEVAGIEVSMLGEAMNDGAQGQRLRVRALNSKRVVEGQVVSANVVKVTL